MSLQKITKLKLPKLPKDLDDKDLQKLVPKLEKEFAAFQKAVDGLLDDLNSLAGPMIEVQDAALKKAGDRKGDPKQAKMASDFWNAYKSFYDQVIGIV